jgi:hypothetical protein
MSRDAIGKGCLVLGSTLAAALLWASPAPALTASSTFDTNDEGWTFTQNFFDPASTLEPVTFMGDHIQALDTSDSSVGPDDYSGAFVSPLGVGSEWSGDWSDNYGGTLSFDLRVDAASPELSPLVALFTGSREDPFSGMVYYDPVGTTPGSSWTHYSIPLIPDQWTDSNTSSTATEADFRAALQNVSGVYLNTDADDTDGEVDEIDNVLLSEPPDSDGDGIPDFQDQCPARPGTGANNGCPPPPSGDKTPPETTITKAKVNSEKRKAKFIFESSEAKSEFLCKLDKGKFKSCESPAKYKKLKPGKHKFQVAARDAAGNLDASPAVEKFKIKK